MKALIILDDSNPVFLEKLRERLLLLARGDYEIALGTEDLSRASLLFTDRQDLPTRQGLDVFLWDAPVSPREPFIRFRYSGARALDRFIRQRLAAELRGNPAGEGGAWTGCHLSFSPSAASKINRAVLRQSLKAGGRIIYLPLKPFYAIEDSFRQGPSDTLGDLLCLIASDQAPRPRDLGSWLYFHDQGYMTFRLPDRAHDLVDCRIQDLAQLVLLVSAYSQTSRDPAAVWLDTAALPFEKLTVLASLCDRIYIDAPCGRSSSAALARRELAIFLAGLPPSCQVMELPGSEEESLASGL